MASGSMIGNLAILLTMDTASFEKGNTHAQKLLAQTQRQFDQMGKKIRNVGKSLTAFVTLPLIAFGAIAVREAQETAHAMGQVEASLKSMGSGAGKTAAQLKKAAEALELHSLEEADVILKKVTAVMLTFGAVTGKTFDRAQQAALDLSAKFGNDLGAAAIMVGKALQDPIKGVGALTRVGVSFSAEQKKMIKTLVTTGQAAKAQELILKALETQVAGSAQKAQDADPYNQLTDAWKQMAEKIGMELIPVLKNLTDALVSLMSAFSSLSPETQKWLLIAAGIGAVLGPVVIVLGAMVSAIGVLLPVLIKIVTLGGLLSPAYLAVGRALGFSAAGATAATGAFSKLGVAMRFMLGPWGAIITAVAAAIYLLRERTNEAAVASEEHRERSTQLTAAQERLKEITDHLAIATGKEAAAARDAARAAQVKAAEDVRAAKAALIRANAEINLAKAMAAKASEQFKADTRSVRGAGGGIDPAMVSGRRAKKAFGVVDQAQADWKAARDNLRLAISNLDSLTRAINAPPKIADIKMPTANAGKTKAGSKERDDSEARAKEMLRLSNEMEQEALDGQRELLQAQQDLTYDYVERAAISRAMIDLEHQQREKQIANDLAMVEADKTISAQQKAEARLRAERQRALNDQLVPMRKQAVNEQMELDRQRQFEQTEQLRYDIQRDLLSAQLGLATTAVERRKIELEILELAYRERRERLNRIIQESKDADEIHRAKMELAKLEKQKALDVKNVEQGTLGPIDTYLQGIPNTVDEINEALENVAANGLKSLEDGLMAVIMGTKSLGAAFKEMALSIIADLLRIQLRQMILKLAGSLGIGTGAVEARAAGGPVRRGSTYLVGEEGPELFSPRNSGRIIANDDLMSGGSGRGMTQNWYITTPDADSFRRSERQLRGLGRRRLAVQ